MLAACSIGETVADLVSHEWHFGYIRASVMFLSLFAIAVAVERRRQVASETRYWTAIVIMSTTGTALADLFTRTLTLGYTNTSLLLITLFAAVLVLVPQATAAPRRGRRPVPDLPRPDARYWAAIMVASTLGTSLGDSVSNVLRLGFGHGTLVLGTLLAAVLVVEHRARTPHEVRYWAALVLTSTIGATSGDFLTKEEGLGFRFLPVIAAQVALFVVLAARRRPQFGI